MKIDIAKIRSKLPVGCSLVGKPDYYETSYRGECILLGVKLPKGKEREAVKALESKGFVVDPNGDGYTDTVEVEIPSTICYAFLNSAPVSSNPVVANALAFNLARYTSMSEGKKARVFLENFLHEGKATRYDDLDLDRIESFFINIDARDQYASAMKKLQAGESVQFKVRPKLQVLIKPL